MRTDELFAVSITALRTAHSRRAQLRTSDTKSGTPDRGVKTALSSSTSSVLA